MILPFTSLLALATFSTAAPSNDPYDALISRNAASYAPYSVKCPNTALTRLASTGVSSHETTYITARQKTATAALKKWLQHVGFKSSSTPSSYPTLALTTSGGGYRSLLCGAGVHSAFDAREYNGTLSTSGLYQALTYEGGLSGGSWLLSSLAANNWPTVTSLMTGIWETAFEDSLLIPENLVDSPLADIAVAADLVAKEVAGYPPTLTDAWGRLLSYQLLYGTDGGVADTISGLRALSNFTTHAAPFPILTSLGVKTWEGECLPGPNATQYEFTPYEFGSWDSGVAAFTDVAYLGSSLNAGKPVNSSACTNNYDNTGYILGTSSSLFNEGCESVPDTDLTSGTLVAALQTLVDTAHAASTRDQYAAYANPFYNLSSSWRVSAQKELDLVDGGEALQNNPIWPFLHRPTVDVLIVNDNSADTSANFPNGSEILTTYTQALSANLTRMPAIPPVATFISQGLNQRPTFFGCHSPSAVTIVYLPNVNYTFPSNEPTAKLEYTAQETQEMVANGVLIGTYGGDSSWGFCLACGVMQKANGVTLPKGCAACLEEFCYN